MTLAADLEKAMSDPLHMTAQELDRHIGEILAKHPPDRDHELSDRPPGLGALLGHMSERDVMQLLRKKYERNRRRRDSEPIIKEGK